MPSIIQNGKSQFLNGTGVPLAGGSVTFYVPGTTTFKTTYQDSGLTIPNSNPITLDANGEAQIWGGGLYRQVVKDSLGNQIWDTVASAGLIASDLINYTYALDTGTANTYVVVRANPTATLADGDVVRFQAKNNNTGTSTLQVDSFSALPLWVNGANLPSGVIVAGADYECIYNLALNVWLLIGQSGGLIVGPGAQLTAGLTGTTATFSGAVSAASAAISGNETVGGTLTVTGTISGAAATANGQAAIMGATNTGAITFTGTASVANATASGHAVNLGQATQDKALAYASAGTSLAAGTATRLALNSTLFDTNSLFNGTDQGFVIKRAGIYLVEGQASANQPNVGNELFCSIFVNGTERIRGTRTGAAIAPETLGSHAGGHVSLNSGDIVTLAVYVSSAATSEPGDQVVYLSLHGPIL